MKRVNIIGAGLGGLATALRLNKLGYEVQIFEKLSRPGGRSNIIEENGFRVDTGPTILVMKESLVDFYKEIGYDLHERLDLVQLDPNYRIYFHDHTYIDLWNNMTQLAMELETIAPGAANQFFRFMGSSAQKYDLGMDFVVRNYDHITDLVNPGVAVRLLKTSAHQNLYKQVTGYFNHNDKLSKTFSFHSMFLGLSPFDSLAMYSMITYADLAFGMWFPKGGIYSIVEDLVDLCRERGVTIYTSMPVTSIDVENGTIKGTQCGSGDYFACDMVVSNADIPYTYNYLIPEDYRKAYPKQRLERMSYACSGYLLYLGVDRTYHHLHHQSLFFSEDYKRNMDSIFDSKRVPDDPSFHLSMPTITDPNLAPPGHSIVYVLAPTPNLQSDIDWDLAAPQIREKLLDQLEWIIDPDIRKHIVWEREYRPADFLIDYNAEYGTAFGSFSQTFFQSAYFRPHNYDRNLNGLYFVGQSTYPGIGMPMTFISSSLVTERIAKSEDR